MKDAERSLDYGKREGWKENKVMASILNRAQDTLAYADRKGLELDNLKREVPKAQTLLGGSL